MNANKKNYIISAVLVIAVFIAAAVGTLMFRDDDSGASSSGDTDISSYIQETDTAATTTEALTAGTTTVRSEEVTTTSATSAEVTEVTTSVEVTSSDSYVEYHFRSSKLLNQHFEKHGGEFGDDFGYKTAKDYEKGASDVINSPDALYKTEAEDGDGVYYIEATNEFVILSTDGYIRTYFLPSGGIDYFNRQ